MDGYKFKRMQSKITVGSKRRFNLTFFFRIIFIITMTFAIMLFAIYISVYSGYQAKLITNIEDIPIEYKQVTIILDEYTDNDNLILGFLDRAYDKRKFTDARIYSLSFRNEETIRAIIKRFPTNRITIDLTKTTILEICKSIPEGFVDKKTIVLSNPDLAIRATSICNSEDVLALPATIEDSELLYYTTSFQIRLEELVKTLVNNN